MFVLFAAWRMGFDPSPRPGYVRADFSCDELTHAGVASARGSARNHMGGCSSRIIAGPVWQAIGTAYLPFP
jgi:hypothetical protein